MERQLLTHQCLLCLRRNRRNQSWYCCWRRSRQSLRYHQTTCWAREQGTIGVYDACLSCSEDGRVMYAESVTVEVELSLSTRRETRSGSKLQERKRSLGMDLTRRPCVELRGRRSRLTELASAWESADVMMEEKYGDDAR